MTLLRVNNRLVRSGGKLVRRGSPCRCCGTGCVPTIVLAASAAYDMRGAGGRPGVDSGSIDYSGSVVSVGLTGTGPCPLYNGGRCSGGNAFDTLTITQTATGVHNEAGTGRDFSYANLTGSASGVQMQGGTCVAQYSNIFDTPIPNSFGSVIRLSLQRTAYAGFIPFQASGWTDFGDFTAQAGDPVAYLIALAHPNNIFRFEIYVNMRNGTAAKAARVFGATSLDELRGVGSGFPNNATGFASVGAAIAWGQ